MLLMWYSRDYTVKLLLYWNPQLVHHPNRHPRSVQIPIYRTVIELKQYRIWQQVSAIPELPNKSRAVNYGMIPPVSLFRVSPPPYRYLSMFGNWSAELKRIVLTKIAQVMMNTCGRKLRFRDQFCLSSSEDGQRANFGKMKIELLFQGLISFNFSKSSTEIYQSSTSTTRWASKLKVT